MVSKKSKRGMIVFQDKKIRRLWHDNQWFYSVVDIVAVLSESDNPTTYWRVLKHREPQLVTICNGLRMPAEDGEPLTNRDLTMQLIDHANAVGLTSILYTNGSFLNQDTIDELFNKNVTLITSLDSLNPETYLELTGFRGFDKVMRNLENFRETYRAGNRVRENGLIETRWGVITIINQHNKREIPKIKEFCGDDAFFICNYPINKGGAKSVWDSYVGTPEDLIDLVKTANMYTDTLVAGLSAPTRSGQCIMLNNGITIDTNENAHACPAMVNTNLGNITNTSVRDIWEKTREYTLSKGNPLCLARDIRQYCKKANILSVGEMLV